MLDEKSVRLKAVTRIASKALSSSTSNTRNLWEFDSAALGRLSRKAAYPPLPDQLKLAVIGPSIERHPSCRSLRVVLSKANQFPPLVEGWS